MAIGLPLALRKRKKGGSLKREELLNHLQGIGVKASLPDRGAAEEKIGVRRFSSERSEGVIKIEAGNINYINVVSVTSQYGVNYLLDYLVATAGRFGSRKRPRLVSRKSSGLWGGVADTEWRGDTYLSQQLNLDSRLKDKLLGVGPDELKGGLHIIPGTKDEYARVRTAYRLPSAQLFQAVDIIAGHVRSGW